MTGSAGFFWFHDPDEVPFTESSDMATYGSVLFGTSIDNNVTHACDSSSAMYDRFANSGSLLQDTFACSGFDWAALSKDLGRMDPSANASVSFAVGFDRTQAINYLNQTQTGLYRSKWPTVGEAIEYFLQDYSSVYQTSQTFDTEVRSRAEAVNSQFGSQYADIIEASVRQTFGEQGWPFIPSYTVADLSLTM